MEDNINLIKRECSIKCINRMLEELDSIQEDDDAQNDSELMNELGEAIGSLENARDILTRKK